MVKAGTSLCIYCGKTMEDAYYYNSANRLWVTLGKDMFGKYVVKPIVPEGFVMSKSKEDESAEYKNFKLVTSINKKDVALKDAIEVDFVEVKKDIDGNTVEKPYRNQEFIRSCHLCCGANESSDNGSFVHPIWPGMGKLPTYVIAVIGDRAVGKSSWLQALAYIDNQNAVEQKYIINPGLIGGKNALGQSTQNFSDGKSQMIKIATRGDDSKPVANVLLLDFPGEIFNVDNFELFKKTPAYRLFTGTDSYSGVDAVVFMDDANEDSYEGVVKTYNSVQKFNLLAGKPVAYVMNKIDLKMQKMQEERAVIRTELLKAQATAKTAADGEKEKVENRIRSLQDSYLALSLLTEDTFNCDEEYYSMAALLPRICLETSIAGRLRGGGGLVKRIMSTNTRTAAFLIKSAEPMGQKKKQQENNSKYKPLLTGVSPNSYVEAPNDGQAEKNSVDTSYKNDFSKPINVMDPLLWILNELDIFPIT